MMTVKVGARTLTDEQAETLLAIYDYLLKQDTPTPLPPSVRDLMPLLGVGSTNTVSNRLRVLAKEGYVMDDEEMSRISRASTRMTYLGHHIAFTLAK